MNSEWAIALVVAGSTLFGAVISGIVGVYLNIRYARQNEVRRTKIDLLIRLVGNRNDILGQDFTEALNQVFAVFHDSPPVKEALHSFWVAATDDTRSDELSNQLLTKLFNAMAVDLDLDLHPLDEKFLLQPFNLRSGSVPRAPRGPVQ